MLLFEMTLSFTYFLDKRLIQVHASVVYHDQSLSLSEAWNMFCNVIPYTEDSIVVLYRCQPCPEAAKFGYLEGCRVQMVSARLERTGTGEIWGRIVNLCGTVMGVIVASTVQQVTQLVGTENVKANVSISIPCTVINEPTNILIEKYIF